MKYKKPSFEGWLLHSNLKNVEKRYVAQVSDTTMMLQRTKAGNKKINFLQNRRHCPVYASIHHQRLFCAALQLLPGCSRNGK